MSARTDGSPPPLAVLYARSLLRRRTAGGGALPERPLVREGLRVDAEHAARYARLLGFGVADELPLTYPHLLAFPSAVQLMVRGPFPFPLLGLVHVRQSVVQRRPLRVHESLTVRVRAERLAPHPRGATVDLVADVHGHGADVDEPAWSGRSTYLHRGGAGSDGPAGTAQPEPPDEAADAGPPDGPPAAVWRLPAGEGRAYAGVSGDVNPIHLHPVAARALGFPRAIAHGMDTVARVAAALQPRLGGATTLEVAFRRPVLLPSTVGLVLRRDRGGPTGPDGVAFAVRSRDGERLHLAGRAAPR